MIIGILAFALYLDGSLCQTNFSTGANISLKCAESYCLPQVYDKLDVPFNDDGAVNVSVDLDVLQVLEVDDIKFTVSFSMYFGVRWQEYRIDGPDPPEDNPYVPIDIDFVKNLWVPDVYIYHLKTIEVLNIFIPFAGLYFYTKIDCFII